MRMDERYDTWTMSDEVWGLDRWWLFIDNLLSRDWIQLPKQIPWWWAIQNSIYEELGMTVRNGCSEEVFQRLMKSCCDDVRKVIEKLPDEMREESKKSNDINWNYDLALSWALVKTIGTVFIQCFGQILVENIMETMTFSSDGGWSGDQEKKRKSWLRDAILNIAKRDKYLDEPWWQRNNKEEMIKLIESKMYNYAELHHAKILSLTKIQVLKNFWVTNTERTSWTDLWVVALSG